jgi:hypothetical protein
MSEDQRVRVGLDGTNQPGGAPHVRSFSLNSDEAYAALCGRGSYDPWIANGALPREPGAWELPVIMGME